jgi:hypothetical protein
MAAEGDLPRRGLGGHLFILGIVHAMARTAASRFWSRRPFLETTNVKERMMEKARSIRVLAWTCVAAAAVGVAVAGRLAAGEQASAAEQPSAEQSVPATLTRLAPEAPAETPVPEKAKSKKREFRGRLPNYYNRVVDQEQREKIYAIQREYAPKIDALKAQLAALVEERDEKVEAVLTPEQLKTVEELQAEAKAKRARARAAKASKEEAAKESDD